MVVRFSKYKYYLAIILGCLDACPEMHDSMLGLFNYELLEHGNYVSLVKVPPIEKISDDMVINTFQRLLPLDRQQTIGRHLTEITKCANERLAFLNDQINKEKISLLYGLIVASKEEHDKKSVLELKEKTKEILKVS